MTKQFKTRFDERWWYFSHPVAPDESYSTAQNMAHAARLQRYLFEGGLWTLNPWFSLVTAYGENGAVPTRDEIEAGIQYDCEAVGLCEGNIVLTGHRISSGMWREFHRSAEHSHAEVINLVGISDRIIRNCASSGDLSKLCRPYSHDFITRTFL